VKIMRREKQGLSEVAAGSGVAGVSGTGRVTGETPTEAAGNEVVAVAKRRRFAPSYKRRIVRAAAACTEPGEIGRLLRREGLYSSNLTQWRKELDAAEHAALSPKARGPKPSATLAEARRTLVLETEVQRLGKKLGRAELIIDAQKKLCEALGLATAEEPLR
jgi:transposase-like protein